jgi:hypothetical protein
MKNLCAFCVLCAFMPAASAQTPFFAHAQNDLLTTVTEADLERPLIEGALRKTGDGLLVLRNPRMPRAQLDILGGTVQVSFTNAFAPPALPAALQQKVAFWVDANTNVVTDGDGNAERWHDVREPSVSGPDFQYMMATNDVALRRPALTADPALGGKKYLDFGKWGGTQTSNDNARFLFMTTSNGLLRTAFALRTVFIVFGSHNGDSRGGGICLIQNTANLSPAPTAPWAAQSTQLWIGGNANVVADDGMNWLDRKPLNGWNVQVPDKNYHLINVTTLTPARANTFGFDRGLLGYSGGARICEALLFTDELGEAERLQTEDYLWHKWFERNDTEAGGYRLADGTAAALDLDDAPHTATVSGAGTVTKSGSGTLTLCNTGTDAFDGTVTLRDGAILTGGEPYLFDIGEGGQTLCVSNAVIQRIAGASPVNAVAKTGPGELAVASISPAVTQLSVAEGTLRLAAPRAPASAATPPPDAIVNNGDLEVFTNGTDPTNPYINYTPTGTPIYTRFGWTFDRSAYDTGIFLVGIVFDTVSGVVAPDSIPDGHAALYLNCGTASTTFTVPSNGLYRLAFQMAARGVGFEKRNVRVQVDGTTLHTVTALSASYWKHALRLPWLAAGTHTVGFEGFGPDLTKVAIIDDIRVEAIAAAETEPVCAVLANPGFEMPAEWLDNGIAVTNAAGTWSDGAWTFENLAGMGRIQIVTGDRSMPAAVPEGIAAGFLATNSVIRQMVTFPEAGRYLLAFEAAGRVALIGHTFEVRLGGATLKTVTTPDAYFRTVEVPLPPVAAGESLELAFVGATDARATASVIDDIRITRTGGTVPDALTNGNFEEGTNGWTFMSFSGVTNNANPWKCTVPLGTRQAYLSMKYSFSQPVTFAQGGSHALSFTAQSYTYSEPGRYHDYDILWDGQPIRRFINLAGGVYRYALPLPPVSDNTTHTLQVRGVDSYGVGSGSCFDDFRIEPCTPRPRLPPTGRFPETTALDIAAGATLALDFDGELKIKDVRYAGHIVSGTISAATHPEFVTGTGTLVSPARGTLISVQ